MRVLGCTALCGVVLLGASLRFGVASSQANSESLEFQCRDESKKRFDVEAVRIGGDIKPPKRLAYKQPEFPEFPPHVRVSGVWIGEILVDRDGVVVDAWAVRTPSFDPPFAAAEFNEAILDALMKWEYEPVEVEGDAVPFCMTVTVNLDLK